MIKLVSTYWQGHCYSKNWLRLFVIIFVCLFSYQGKASDDYKLGLTAYFDGNYALAKSHWLKGATQGQAKSMFNLGLLHEQSKIDDAQQDKAEEWFHLASKAGYSPASYHLALRILQGKGSDEKASQLLRAAADAGYSPAIQYLGEGKKSVQKVVVANTSAANISKAPQPKNRKSRSKEYLSEPWILSKKPKYWTIQMLAFSEEVRVQNFIKQNKIKDKAAYFLETSNGKSLYKLIYGVYKTKIKADFARQNLDQSLKQHGPWLRSIESVQSVIKAQ